MEWCEFQGATVLMSVVGVVEQGWYDAGEVKPRNIAPSPRCPDCQTGGMFHPVHPGRQCGVKVDGVECQCQPSATSSPA